MLQAANQQALNSSFQVDFSSQLHVDLSGVTGLTGVSSRELSLVQAEINSAGLTGTAQVQSQTQAEVTLSLPPLLSQPLHVIELNGAEYVSEDGTQWHVVGAGQSGLAGGLGSAAGGSLTNLRSELRSWGQDLRNSATVTNLGNTEINGSQVDHLRTNLSGAAMSQVLSQVLSSVASQLTSSAPALSSELPLIEQLLQFTEVKADSYVLTSSGKLDRASLAVGLKLDLSTLSTLAPAGAGLPGGTASLTYAGAANFSAYGQNFNIQKPSQIVAGPLPTPSGLASALS
jgi:hypothetical protein